MGKSQRDKGKRGEREVVRILTAAGNWPARRGWQSAGGRLQCDVEGTPLWTEVKRGKRCNIRAAMAQALADTDGRPVAVFTREDGGDWLCTLDAVFAVECLALYLRRFEPVAWRGRETAP